MSELLIRLPSTTSHSRAVIEDCLARIHRFVIHDAYSMYDYWIATLPLPADTITDRHIDALNRAMFARSSRKAWSRFTDKLVPELREIPPDLDLFDSQDHAVEAGWRALARATRRMAATTWITDMAISKVLHLLRPRF